MIPQNYIHSSGIDVHLPANAEVEVTEITSSPKDGVSETTGTALQVTKLDVAHYRHEDWLFWVNQTNNFEIPLHVIGDCRFLFLE